MGLVWGRFGGGRAGMGQHGATPVSLRRPDREHPGKAGRLRTMVDSGSVSAQRANVAVASTMRERVRH